MIAVDTSALIAIILREPDRDHFRKIIYGKSRILVSTVTLVETSMVVNGRRGQRGTVVLDDVLDLSIFDIVAPVWLKWKWRTGLSSLTAKAMATRRS